ncbi:MAG: hypothetical protein R3F49_07710 [Planctomycetota bacterium]
MAQNPYISRIAPGHRVEPLTHRDPTMKNNRFLFLTLALLPLGLTSCDPDDAGDVAEDAVDKVQDAAEEVGDEIGDAARKVERKIDDGIDKAKN